MFQGGPVAVLTESTDLSLLFRNCKQNMHTVLHAWDQITWVSLFEKKTTTVSLIIIVMATELGLSRNYCRTKIHD